MHWIIGTAGHIDHGKTSLIKALTGEDTDRLEEEKARGISIDLGFAHLDLASGDRAGVVDVPGHERFIRNMLAGAHGIDLVLLTVAADDGVMPQTREHVDILHLLGVTRAIVVITKADLASGERRQDVAGQMRELIAGTSLEGAPMVPYSFVTGEGLDHLRAQIDLLLHDNLRPKRQGVFRLPVDRAFTLSGHGLIVTGTAIAGEVRPGDTVRRLPGGELLRVRSLEVHNLPAEVAAWGQRAALNLTGATHSPIGRGDVIGHESLTQTCDRFDARIEVRPTAKGGLEDHQRVRVYLGTAERMGKVIPLGSRSTPQAETIMPGDSAYGQITLEQPLVAMRGDRFILRDETAQRTIGGGVVILPSPPRHKRRDPRLLGRLATLDHGDGAPLIEALLEQRATFAMPLPALAELLNGRGDDIRRRLDAMDGVHVFHVDGTPHYASQSACERAKAALHQTIKGWHAAHPLTAGIDLEEARTALPEPVSAKLFRLLVQELIDAQSVVRDGSLLRLPDYRIAVPEGDRALVERILSALAHDPLSPPDAKQLATSLSVEHRKLVGLMRAMEKQQALVGVTPDLYFLRGTVDEVRADLVSMISTSGEMTTVQFRDRHKTSRKYAIPLLEYFDRTGVTVRIGDVRQLKQPAATQGPA